MLFILHNQATQLFLIQVINCGELLSKWVGESAKNIDAIFEEARSTDAILVFDEAEGLFGTRTETRYTHNLNTWYIVILPALQLIVTLMWMLVFYYITLGSFQEL